MSNGAAQTSELVSRDRVIGAVRMALRNAIIVERSVTVEQLSGAAGVPVRTIRSYMANDPGEVREPTLSNALSIACVLGPRAVNAVMALIGYSARPLEDEEGDCPMQVTAQGMAHLSVIATAAADGRIDHIERPGVRNAADMLIQIMTPLSSAGDAA